MKIRYHRRVPQDVQEIRDYYAAEGGLKIADAFFDELVPFLERAVENPKRFHLDRHGARRVNLKRFLFHFRYQIRAGFIYVLVVKHNKRHPSFGLRRK